MLPNIDVDILTDDDIHFIVDEQALLIERLWRAALTPTERCPASAAVHDRAFALTVLPPPPRVPHV